VLHDLDVPASAATLTAWKGAEIDMSIASATAMPPSNPATRSRLLIYAPHNSVSSVDPQKRLSVAFIRIWPPVRDRICPRSYFSSSLLTRILAIGPM